MGPAAKFANLPVDEIRDGPNVRLDLRDIDVLVASVREHGVLQAITVVPDETGSGAEVLLGRRRLEAARRVGLPTIPCRLESRPRDTERVVKQLTENLQRNAMTPLELALAYAEMVEAGYSVGGVARVVGFSEQWVKRTLRLLDMPECVQMAAHAGTITMTAATDIPISNLNVDGAVDRLTIALNRHGKTGLQRWFRGESDRVKLAQARDVPERTQPRQIRLPLVMEIADYERLCAYAAGDPGRFIWDAVEEKMRRIDDPNT